MIPETQTPLEAQASNGETPPETEVKARAVTPAKQTKVVTSVRKRNNDVEEFDEKKLAASIHSALVAAGIKQPDPWVPKLTGYVRTRLDNRFDGHTVPTTHDLRDVVELTFIDNNLMHVAKQYLTHRVLYEDEMTREPVYGKGITFSRFFTKPSAHPFDEIKWEERTARITNEKGEVVFEQEDVEVPVFWSQTATNIVVQKYFVGKLGTPERETSVKQIITRVAHTIADWGRYDGYFAAAEDAEAFEAELTYALVNQFAAFNSPVWFNVGVPDRLPQCSACQPYHSLVSTPQGFIPIGEIVRENRVGLPVFDSKGTTRVVATKSNGKKQVYKVKLANGSFIEATGDHLVRAVNERRTEPSWVRIDALREGMRLHLHPHVRVAAPIPAEERTYSFPSNSANFRTKYADMHFVRSAFAPTKEVSEAALAGWLQADGFVGQYKKGTNRSLTIEFQTANDAEMVWIMMHLDHVFPDVHRHVISVKLKEQKTNYRKIRLYGEVLRPFVEKYDLLKRRTEIRVPTSLWQAPEEVMVAYLRSVFQGDGFVSVRPDYNNARIGFSVISEKWVEDIQLLLLGLGIYSRRLKKQDKRNNRQDIAHLEVNYASERKRFAEIIGFVDPKKGNKLWDSFELPNGLSCPDLREEAIVAIEDEGEMEVFDIQTESGEYLSNHVAVHNCFINSVQDDMRSILQLAMTEGMLFKYGSGTGTNLSTLRSRKEHLANSPNRSSGPVSFMKAYDAIAGMVKSGGKTRRAAKMVILNIEHPDVLDFIQCKAKEEKKAWALMDAGYDGSITGEAYSSIFYQNANNSVRVTDDFMQAVVDDKEWWTRFVLGGEPCEKHRARELMREIAEAAWQCGDPGIQADTTINKWNTLKNTGRINASNPCSEFVAPDDSACNLASINLMKHRKEDGEFDVEIFQRTCETMITAQEIIVDNAYYPTPAIEQNSYDQRALGIGYANLGALIMARGLPYDSDEGRNYAAVITALMTGVSYAQSAKIAERLGPFHAFEKNREPMLEVMQMHYDEVQKIPNGGLPEDLLEAAQQTWQEVVEQGKEHGFRNSQVSLLAPTGTIAFLMDCDTTGVEPDIALVKYKWLVGGGMIKIINNTVPEALARLGYTGEQIDDILGYINDKDTIEDAPHLKEEHLAVFDCAFKPQNGKRAIHHMGHIKMMAATQPFLSGAISKTINMPNESTVEDIMEVYVESWKLGVKSMAIYRDGSKRQQPLTTSLDQDQSGNGKVVKDLAKPRRRRLPDERRSVTHKFAVGGHEGYITVGLYDDSTPGEIFITMSKEGSVISGLMDSFATSISIALQYGVPLKTLVNKFVHMRFEPSGFTSNPSIKIAKSIVDYVFRWVALKFLPPEDQQAVGINVPTGESASMVEETKTPEVPAAPAPQATIFEAAEAKEAQPESALAGLVSTFDNTSDAPVCCTCGSIMVRYAACYRCLNCGETSGCS